MRASSKIGEEPGWRESAAMTLGEILRGVVRWLLKQQWVASLLDAIPPLGAWVNRRVIDMIVSRVRTRPHPYGTVHDYVSWRGLTDLTWSSRHLPPYPWDEAKLPAVDEVAKLFVRPAGPQRLCPKSTCLFPTFAQYLTDGFIRTATHPDEADLPLAEQQALRKQTTSNHQIDLCPLYGRTREQTLALRVDDPATEGRGRLKSQQLPAGEFAPFLFREGEPNPAFAVLDRPLGLDGKSGVLARVSSDDPETRAHAIRQRDHLFAFGGDRANSAPQAAMMNTLLLREHNRLADGLAARNPDWDDDRVFETARNIVIVEFIKIVVEDYINHITPFAFNLRADPSVAWTAPWNRTNWITTEFSLLYRWHALIPDEITWGGKTYAIGETFLNNTPLLEIGVERGFEAMSRQRAGALGAFNTTRALQEVEKASIRQGRFCSLAPFADYRRYMGDRRPKTFEDISTDPDVARLLRDLYGEVDRVEFFPGLFAEDRVADSPLPKSVLTLVAVDAFSQALTNPLLSEHVFNPDTFSAWGWEQIGACSRLADLVRRNAKNPDALGPIVMTRTDWEPGEE